MKNSYCWIFGTVITVFVIKCVAVPCDLGEYHDGVVTPSTFHADEGICLLNLQSPNIYAAGIGDGSTNDAYYCGSCVNVSTPHAFIVAMVVDECKECVGDYDITLDIDAMNMLSANTGQMDVNVRWHLIPCPGMVRTKNITFEIQGVGSMTEFAIRAVDHAYPVTAMEVSTDGTLWSFLVRDERNYYHRQANVYTWDTPFLIKVYTTIEEKYVSYTIDNLNESQITSNVQFDNCGGQVPGESRESCDLGLYHDGLATPAKYTNYNGSCSLVPPPLTRGIYSAGIGDGSVVDAYYCGACVNVSTARAYIVAMVIDKCRGCVEQDDITLDEEGIYMLTGTWNAIDVTWRLTACPGLVGVENITFEFQTDSDVFAVRATNHIYPVTSMRLYYYGEWRVLIRDERNYYHRYFDSTQMTTPFNLTIFTSVTRQYVNYTFRELSLSPIHSNVQFDICDGSDSGVGASPTWFSTTRSISNESPTIPVTTQVLATTQPKTTFMTTPETTSPPTNSEVTTTRQVTTKFKAATTSLQATTTPPPTSTSDTTILLPVFTQIDPTLPTAYQNTSSTSHTTISVESTTHLEAAITDTILMTSMMTSEDPDAKQSSTQENGNPKVKGLGYIFIFAAVLLGIGALIEVAECVIRKMHIGSRRRQRLMDNDDTKPGNHVTPAEI
uniref:Uncharacterized protein LOC102808323 n=1 Tax=Saccoglossus kowalevskii TaxID=10224 RepID=A0ABM0LXN0_SACKO|nr:PREDICTED: uncharacterized protein LOC102808323 [Saccoglossus kowalevskii]